MPHFSWPMIIGSMDWAPNFIGGSDFRQWSHALLFHILRCRSTKLSTIGTNQTARTQIWWFNLPWAILLNQCAAWFHVFAPRIVEMRLQRGSRENMGDSSPEYYTRTGRGSWYSMPIQLIQISIAVAYHLVDIPNKFNLTTRPLITTCQTTGK